jgi:hypothetical protein
MMQETKTTLCNISRLGDHHGENEIHLTQTAASSATARTTACKSEHEVPGV